MGGPGVHTEPTASWGGLVILPVNGSMVCSLYQNHMIGFAQQPCALGTIISLHFLMKNLGVTQC